MINWPFPHMPPLKVQTEALRRSEGRKTYGYFMEQGLAKTLTLYADFIRTILRSDVQGLACLMPSYLKGNWLEEAKKVGLEKRLKFYMWPDNNCRELYDIGPHKNFVLLMNFEALLYSGGEFLEDVLHGHNCMMNLDEPSPMRRSGTATCKKIVQLAQNYSQHRRITYGTPDPESPLDWYSQLRFLGEIEGWVPAAFRNHFCVMGGYMGKQIRGRRNEDELAKIVARVGFRALKKDWWEDAPEKLYTEREIVLEGKQLEHYKRMEQEFWTFVEEKGEQIEIYADQAVHMLEKLQQISRGFIIDSDGKPRELVPAQNNPAIKLVNNIITETGSKLIVFTTHKFSINQLDLALQEYRPAVLRGGMEPAEIEREKARFNNDPSCRVILGNDVVMAHGHTLLGGSGNDHCSTTLFYENSFKNEMRLHAEDRNHRIGQDRAVLYIDLVASRQDRRVIKAVQNKKSLMLALAEAVKRVQQEMKVGKRQSG